MPIPKEPPFVPLLSDAPVDLVRLLQAELYSSVEPVSPVVLKSLILRHIIFEASAVEMAFSKNFLPLRILQ